MRITAVVATMLDAYEPSSWTRLVGSDADRVLVSDGEREYVASIANPEREAASQAERVASAVLQPLLPESAPTIPHVVASRTVDGALVEREGTVTVMVSSPMPGLPLATSMFEERPQLVESLANAIAAIHSADPGPIADAGLVVEESAETRERLLADLDSAASTGRVPSTLLSRWETTLENVSAWRFLPVPIHGNVGPDALWVDEQTVVGMSDLARLRVGDPAADLAAVSSMLSPEDFERFFRTYRSRRGADDPGLRRRVGFHSEITVLEWLLAAVAAQDDDAIEDAAQLLEALADVTGDADGSHEQAPSALADGGPEPTTAEAAAEAPSAAADDAPADEDASAADDAAVAEDATAAEDAPTTDDAPSAEGTQTGEDTPATETFLPSARIEAGVDEDGISTERLDTSELHLRSIRDPDQRDG
ncbi:phosphotransferase [Brevibacterium yomogidense]|uniref:Macrolide 2'-phosphotransferase n=1 Tax=Brevibacterium yomogidense TaxID=946573 RepID=A0A1X6XLB5_9MICO|nr:phosphotransferase [Brevibacterium yomogidense]SLN00125.1 Macrolide 2'-phosphotransferase [Brevibacterium yomogidense]